MSKSKRTTITTPSSKQISRSAPIIDPRTIPNHNVSIASKNTLDKRVLKDDLQQQIDHPLAESKRLTIEGTTFNIVKVPKTPPILPQQSNNNSSNGNNCNRHQNHNIKTEKNSTYTTPASAPKTPPRKTADVIFQEENDDKLFNNIRQRKAALVAPTKTPPRAAQVRQKRLREPSPLNIGRNSVESLLKKKSIQLARGEASSSSSTAAAESRTPFYGSLTINNDTTITTPSITKASTSTKQSRWDIEAGDDNDKKTDDTKVNDGKKATKEIEKLKATTTTTSRPLKGTSLSTTSKSAAKKKEEDNKEKSTRSNSREDIDSSSKNKRENPADTIDSSSKRVKTNDVDSFRTSERSTRNSLTISGADTKKSNVSSAAKHNDIRSSNSSTKSSSNKEINSKTSSTTDTEASSSRRGSTKLLSSSIITTEEQSKRTNHSSQRQASTKVEKSRQTTACSPSLSKRIDQEQNSTKDNVNKEDLTYSPNSHREELYSFSPSNAKNASGADQTYSYSRYARPGPMANPTLPAGTVRGRHIFLYYQP